MPRAHPPAFSLLRLGLAIVALVTASVIAPANATSPPHLFGSEENSARAKPIQERMPEPYVALARDEAARLGVNDGALLALRVNDQALRLPLQVRDDLAIGLVGLPVGLPGIAPTLAGASVTLLQEAAQ